ncbi:hypothetical protein BC567DRAFT_235680 [Phyllosticta citribraziliensis]
MLTSSVAGSVALPFPLPVSTVVVASPAVLVVSFCALIVTEEACFGLKVVGGMNWSWERRVQDRPRWLFGWCGEVRVVKGGLGNFEGVCRRATRT